jgi:hypothetical protein
MWNPLVHPPTPLSAVVVPSAAVVVIFLYSNKLKTHEKIGGVL